ncbi:macrophage mannose receptor 1-like [Saccostrea echinata]|uniref:macrophage mannose receptor 1-like n=1 Tax=Saccostrea echinata TaxID=191078 RepID=UPI002A80B76D|nr:macrophage mannose receptor 1-like [Saccostrea echinata]
MPGNVTIIDGDENFCESGWYPFTGHCYHLNKTAVQWRDAQTQCKRQKSYLVEVNTAAENKWLLETFLTANGNGISQPVTSLWLGAKRRKGILMWGHSNNPISKQSWVTENLDGKGGCVLMKHTGMWIDVGCSWDEYFVCEKML